ncbi:tetratricopeptide repeat protein [Flavobacterium sp.]|uniref:tetratricopeptide repeat protein n=1 Tax=Flavobacterium sp. TaxID=239 RepID=UPI0038FCFC2B
MKNIILILMLFFSISIFSQKKDFDLPQANENYIKKEYALAESNYRISKANNEKRATASYNLGNAIYKQNQPTEAKYAYSKAIENAKGKQQKFSAFHNIGNVFMKEKDYSKAVDAYKNALRNNPKDEQTRYNYALAKKMLKDNPPKKDDKKKDDKKDKDKDKKDEPKDDKKDKPKEGDDKKDDKGKPKDDKQNEQPKPQQGGANQERMKNLLDAVNNEEKKTQEKVNGKKVKGKPVETDKDW